VFAWRVGKLMGQDWVHGLSHRHGTLLFDAETVKQPSAAPIELRGFRPARLRSPPVLRRSVVTRRAFTVPCIFRGVRENIGLEGERQPSDREGRPSDSRKEIDVHGQEIKPPVTESTRFPNASANTGNNARWRRSIRSKFLDVTRRATCCHHLVSRSRCGSRFGKPQPGRRGARARKCGALWEPEELLPFESTTRKGGLWPRSVSTLRGTC
jgi:hypothetical protein